ncbi:MAG: hypothetical protein DRJ55_05500 [Thermoprotei archaeon]|nr:MAG: hypothetical protein DRJ55_05500 [Thermoprotei archaeon]
MLGYDFLKKFQRCQKSNAEIIVEEKEGRIFDLAVNNSAKLSGGSRRIWGMCPPILENTSPPDFRYRMWFRAHLEELARRGYEYVGNR